MWHSSRLQFGLRLLLLFIAVLALAISAWKTHRELEMTNRELERTRSELTRVKTFHAHYVRITENRDLAQQREVEAYQAVLADREGRLAAKTAVPSP